MSPESQPVPVLEYQPESSAGWAAVVRICAWIGIVLGTTHVISLLGAVYILYALAPLAIFTSVSGGLLGIAAIIGGAGCLQMKRGFRGILIWACAGLMLVLPAQLTWELIAGFQYVELWSVAMLLLHVGGTPLAAILAPAALFLLLRRPEARRVFEAGR